MAARRRHKSALVGGILPILLGIGLSSCQSKFEEPPPTKVTSEPARLEERLENKKAADRKLDLLQRLFGHLDDVFGVFRKAHGKGDDYLTYSPLNLLGNLLYELRGSLPQALDGQFVQTASVLLADESLPEACRRVNAVMRTSQEGEAETIMRLQRRKCSERGYIEGFEVRIKGEFVTVRYSNDSLRELFARLPKLSESTTAECKLRVDAEGILKTVECSNIFLELARNNSAWIESLRYEAGSRIKFDSQSVILVDGEPKTRSYIHANGSLPIPRFEPYVARGPKP